jgi:aspartate 1-decarboxylase
MWAKIHNATISDAHLNYIGSITIPEDLMKLAGLFPYEKVLVVSNHTGERLETYCIVGRAKSGHITINGAAAHKIKKGEQVIIMSFRHYFFSHLSHENHTSLENYEKDWKYLQEVPKAIWVDENNQFIQYLESSEAL